MKIAVASSGNTLDSPVDVRFGRCPWFVVVDSDTMEFTAVPNPAAGATGGAGIQAAQLILSQGAQALVAGNIGPNAFQVLSAAGMRVVPFASGTVRQAVEAVAGGSASSIDAPTVQSHAGMSGAGPFEAGAPPLETFPGAGRRRGGGSGGPGRGFGRGGRRGR
ncbi:MAG: NifB/NifX family molybdenum-iron cluster-binding protein [Armatimonadota bacterium]